MPEHPHQHVWLRQKPGWPAHSLIKLWQKPNLQTAFEAYQSLTGLDVQSLSSFDGPAVLPQSMADAEEQANAERPSVIAAVLGEKFRPAV